MIHKRKRSLTNALEKVQRLEHLNVIPLVQCIKFCKAADKMFSFMNHKQEF